MAMAVLLLLAAELDSGQTDAPGDSLDLVAAVRTGDPAAVGRSLRRREALKHHDDDDGAMAVVAAAADGHTAAPEIIGALLAAGIPVDRIDAQGRTALQWAAYQGHVPVVTTLLHDGAAWVDRPTDAGRQIPGLPGQQWTPLSTAAHRGHVEVARVLLQAGAAADHRDAGMSTPLMLAANAGHDAVVSLLLQHRVAFQAQNKIGVTPLMYASVS